MATNFGRMAGITLGLALAIVTPALAQQGEGRGPVAQACAEDIGKFCEGIAHGGGKVRACLESNKDKVSAACQTALATHGQGRAKVNGGGPQ